MFSLVSVFIFIISRIPGLGFGTLIRHPAFFILPDWLPGFH